MIVEFESVFEKGRMIRMPAKKVWLEHVDNYMKLHGELMPILRWQSRLDNLGQKIARSFIAKDDIGITYDVWNLGIGTAVEKKQHGRHWFGWEAGVPVEAVMV